MKKVLLALFALTSTNTAWCSESKDRKDVKASASGQETKTLNQLLDITSAPQTVKHIMLAYLAGKNIDAPACITLTISADNKEIITLDRHGKLSWYAMDGTPKQKHNFIRSNTRSYYLCALQENDLFSAIGDISRPIKVVPEQSRIFMIDRPDYRTEVQRLLSDECARLKKYGIAMDTLSKTNTTTGQHITISLDGTLIAQIVGDTIQIYPANVRTLTTEQLGTLYRMGSGETIDQAALKKLTLSQDNAQGFDLIAQANSQKQEISTTVTATQRQVPNLYLTRRNQVFGLALFIALVCALYYGPTSEGCIYALYIAMLSRPLNL